MTIGDPGPARGLSAPEEGVVAPLVVGLIWRETFVPAGGQPFDLPALARQHVETLAAGLLTPEAA